MKVLVLARQEFEQVFAKSKLPSDIPEMSLLAEEGSLWISKALTAASLSKSNGEASRLIKQGALSVDGKKVKDSNYQLTVGGSYLIKLGKRRFCYITVEAS